MANGRAHRLLHAAEGVAYWAAVAPFLARLPAAAGYRAACRRGDWVWRQQPAKCAEITRNLREVLGTGLAEGAEQWLARDWFRHASCEALDLKRLRGSGRPLRRLIELRGREHLDAALAAGRGVIVCSAHYGSFDSWFSLLGAIGYPVTAIGRWQHNYTTGMSAVERRFWDRVYARPLRRHRKHPNIEPWAGRFQVAVQAAGVLRANEVLTIAIDAPLLDGDQDRAVSVPFLGRRARLLPGAVALARATGAPVLLCFAHRRPDYRHQVLELSAPIPLDGDPDVAFGRCAAVMSEAIASDPAPWRYWASSADLVNLGLVNPGLVNIGLADAPAAGAPRPRPRCRWSTSDLRSTRRRATTSHPQRRRCRIRTGTGTTHAPGWPATEWRPARSHRQRTPVRPRRTGRGR